MQQQILMFEANKQTKQQYNVPTRLSIHTPSYGVTGQPHCGGCLAANYTALGASRMRLSHSIFSAADALHALQLTTVPWLQAKC
jgi:hypothetical protein